MLTQADSSKTRSVPVTDRVLGVVGKISHHRVAGPATVIGLASTACVGIWLADPTTPGGPSPICPTKLLFGINCPGCGSLRAIYSLMHGDVVAAVHFNAVGVLCIALLLWAFGAYCLGLWRGRRVRSWQHHRWMAMILLVVVGIWFVIRNIPVYPFTALRV
ncbi:hypothetical protein GOEFS_098_00240 [Gordonia effusa NBRC 100432]|uniref:DUF2752 domain-containing protein n=1 Tax=Gordonia effusa NBRC 100432 TaxID=1077974 RepID=H0R4F7_9ACTN|nr:DUF2752 domain-containing protein [Gordonia effusa]GAB19958.1 hypothetical protein GOEFS_098_00240 [Gordonia effusa NBRC 100432]